MRWYSIADPPGTDPVRLPSVTTILDVTMPQQRRDTLIRAEMANPTSFQMKREAAMARGIAVDQWLKHCLTTGRLFGVPPAVAKQCSKLLPLVRGILAQDAPVWADHVVHDASSGYAGTLDIVATLATGEAFVIEVKTSAYTIWPEAVAEAQLQAIAYRAAWLKMYPARPIAGIATWHVTPYLFHEVRTVAPAALNRLEAAWWLRLRQFASRYTAMGL